MSAQPSDTPHGQFALHFARLLVAGCFDSTHSLLSRALREAISPDQLREEYESMISYGHGPPDFVGVIADLID